MSSDDPPLLRPIPRRPFDLHLTTPTPPENSSTPSPEDGDANLLNPNKSVDSNGDADSTSSFSRTRSIMNLTSSTLFGIYSPGGYNEREEPSTPWGTGAETPNQRMSIDSGSIPTLAGRLDRPILRKRTSHHVNHTSTPVFVLNLIVRSVLLFGFGMGYGLLVTHLHDDRKVAPFKVEGIIKPSYNWPYLIFWGVSGVALGSLLPLVDTLWEETTSDPKFVNSTRERSPSPETEEVSNEDGGLTADWSPAVRSIGAFVGIAFAIRKLPWASTLQVSLTLALVNPVLWYLVDRSKPGFLLSAAVGVFGTSILLSLNPEMVPSPLSTSSSPLPSSSSSSSYLSHNASTLVTDEVFLGGLVSKNTIECGTWILSVLFCSCVCFGNIGRRLALKRAPVNNNATAVRRDSFKGL